MVRVGRPVVCLDAAVMEACRPSPQSWMSGGSPEKRETTATPGNGVLPVNLRHLKDEPQFQELLHKLNCLSPLRFRTRTHRVYRPESVQTHSQSF